MQPAETRQSTAGWLLETGLKELELLFGSILYYPSDPILLTNNDRNCLDASSGACKLLDLSRDKIIGRRIDDFTDPGFRPQIEKLWHDFLERGEQEGTFRLAAPDGKPRDVEYTAKGNVLPARHLMVLRAKTKKKAVEGPGGTDADLDPQWERDYALFLLDVDGRVASWYSGAERIYGYNDEAIVGQHVSCLY